MIITDRVPKAHGAVCEGGGQSAAAVVSLLPCIGYRAMDYRFAGRVDQRSPLQKPEWGQRGVVGRILGQIIYISLH